MRMIIIPFSESVAVFSATLRGCVDYMSSIGSAAMLWRNFLVKTWGCNQGFHKTRVGIQTSFASGILRSKPLGKKRMSPAWRSSLLEFFPTKTIGVLFQPWQFKQQNNGGFHRTWLFRGFRRSSTRFGSGPRNRPVCGWIPFAPITWRPGDDETGWKLDVPGLVKEYITNWNDPPLEFCEFSHL